MVSMLIRVFFRYRLTLTLEPGLGRVTLQGLQHLEYHAQSVKLDNLDKLCHKLSCTPCDLIEFKPDRSSS